MHIAAQAGELSKTLHIAAAEEGHLDIVKVPVNDAKNKCKVKRSKDMNYRQERS